MIRLTVQLYFTETLSLPWLSPNSVFTVLFVFNIIKMSVCAGYLSVNHTVHEWLLTGHAGPWYYSVAFLCSNYPLISFDRCSAAWVQIFLVKIVTVCNFNPLFISLYWFIRVGL